MNKFLFSAACVAALTLASHAQTIYQTGFENPPFNPGNIIGQDGWLRDNFFTASLGTIGGEQARSGSQSMKVTPQVDAGGDTYTWFFKTVPYNTSTAGNKKIIVVKWDMYLTSSTLQGIYGIDCYNDGTGGLARLCTMAVLDTNQVQLLSFTDGTQQTAVNTGVFVSRDEWHRYRLVLNYNNRTFDAYVDGQLVGSGTLQTAGGAIFGDADIYNLNIGGDSDDVGYFDNHFVGAYNSILPGDVNGDGCVNDEDLLLVLFNFGSPSPLTDLDDNGTTDDVDLLLVLFNFGAGC
ncbi:MAG: hypothetical protein KIT45_11985 [Fimbriimonadia bacterium]|nr:hypothetical protein [Fimbriimonadia bacterium]